MLILIMSWLELAYSMIDDFLFFIAFVKATKVYQDIINLKSINFVGFFPG
ncbi:MAG: hypothetical protein LBB45_08975 [Methanobrevibacter sp.]|nr:hypothetical protein [Candidatus Methanovirga basalitermitum]